MADILRAYVLERALTVQAHTAVDAYAGSGHSAIALSQHGIAVSAIEVDKDAAAWSAARLEPPSRSLCAKVEDALPGVLPADLVILNPPRAGVDARVTDALEAHSIDVEALIYVSCNPATLARDLSRLPSYSIDTVQAFDMFPQTAHVETVCMLRPARQSR
jgi:23S rRNA (uracil1939-C5)-methyltransferase